MGGFSFTATEMEQTENKEEFEELTREQKLLIEEQAIMALMAMGVKFSVPLKIHPVKQPRWVRLWNKLFPNKPKIWRDRRIPKSWDVSTMEIPDIEGEALKEIYVRNFHIKPLYLGAIDAIRLKYIEIEYNENTIQDEPIQESKKLFKYISVMTEIAAIAVLNETSIASPRTKEVKELSSFFREHLTTQRLHKLNGVINQMMDAGGFTNSIRLIKEIGTTKPKPKASRIEL